MLLRDNSLSEEGVVEDKVSLPDLKSYPPPHYGAGKDTLDSRHPMEQMRRQRDLDSTLGSNPDLNQSFVTVVKIPGMNDWAYPNSKSLGKDGMPLERNTLNEHGSVYGYTSPKRDDNAAPHRKSLHSARSVPSIAEDGAPTSKVTVPHEPVHTHRPPVPPPDTSVNAETRPYLPYDITASALNMNEEGVYDVIPSLSSSNRYIGHAPAAITAAVSLSRPWNEHDDGQHEEDQARGPEHAPKHSSTMKNGRAALNGHQDASVQSPERGRPRTREEQKGRDNRRSNRPHEAGHDREQRRPHKNGHRPREAVERTEL